MFDFNTITLDQEKAAVALFKEHGRGVNMSKFIGESLTSDSAAKWTELINPERYSPRIIKQKMLDVSRIINTNCNDELLGKLDSAFSITTERDEQVEIKWIDVYSFLRAAYRYQSETAAFKKQKQRIAELESYIATNKSRREKLTEAHDELKNLKSVNS